VPSKEQSEAEKALALLSGQAPVAPAQPVGEPGASVSDSIVKDKDPAKRAKMIRENETKIRSELSAKNGGK
jgi:hypothetical protein